MYVVGIKRRTQSQRATAITTLVAVATLVIALGAAVAAEVLLREVAAAASHRQTFPAAVDPVSIWTRKICMCTILYI